MGPHMEFRARKEPPGKGEDLLGLDCITLDRKMALPINPVDPLGGSCHFVSDQLGGVLGVFHTNWLRDLLLPRPSENGQLVAHIGRSIVEL